MSEYGIIFVGVYVNHFAVDLTWTDCLLCNLRRWSMRNSISCPIMKARQELEFGNVQFIWWNTKFMIEFANSRMFDTHDSSISTARVHFVRFHAMQWMRTACVGPDLYSLS